MDSKQQLRPIISPLLEKLGVRHGFFSRHGGVSGADSSDLNCGLKSQDEPKHVAENRRRVANYMGAPLHTLRQVHSNRVQPLADPNDELSEIEADAIVTKAGGQAIAAVMADCGPVLFADIEAGVIASAHAGWRGAFDGVLENCVAEMVKQGADKSRIHAALGPCIAQASYEVGADFRQRFVDHDPDFATFFIAGRDDAHCQFDLKGFIASKLETVLDPRNVEILPHDTCADDENFFSYRRATLNGEPDYFRHVAAIALP